MVENIERLNSLYTEIILLTGEILEINDSYEHVVQLESSIISKELQVSLKDVSSVFSESVKSRKSKLEESINAFKELMSETFKVKVELDFSGGFPSVSILEEVNNLAFLNYMTILEGYVKDFLHNGIVYEDITLRINNIIHDVLGLALNLSSFYKQVKRANLEFLEKAGILEMLSSQISAYKRLIYSYKKFLQNLEKSGKISLDESSVQHIIDNTSLMPLVFANNEHPLIGRANSLRRLFLCQNHVEKTPSMRVSIDRNLFICFGCGWNGNQIDYLSKMHNITYAEAIYLLAEIFLIDIPNNPFREGERASLAESYREVLVSERYNSFLMDSMARTCKVNPSNEALYSKMFSQIERVKSGTWDDNIEHKVREERYLDLSRNRRTKKILTKDEYFLPELPF